MLDRNFTDLTCFLDQLRSRQHQDNLLDQEEANRLLLNYLTFVYTIKEHFDKSLTKSLRRSKLPSDSHGEFTKKLCDQFWEFAFIMDFRGYVQHVGLGIGSLIRRVTPSDVLVEITADPKLLTKESRSWKLSNLQPSAPPVDLIGVIQRFHTVMLSDYASFMANAFFPGLKEVSQFYSKLAHEVATYYPDSRMVFSLGFPEASEVEGKKRMKLQLSFPPSSVLAELGICKIDQAE